MGTSEIASMGHRRPNFVHPAPGSAYLGLALARIM